jgi:hypothetical protein
MQTTAGGKKKIFGQVWCPIDDIPWHLWRFTSQTFRLFMKKAGFHVATVDSLEPSLFSAKSTSNSRVREKLALRVTAETSKILHTNARMLGYAQKTRTGS